MSWKYKLVEWYIEQRNRHGTGQAFFGFFAGLVQFYVLAKVYIKLILGVELHEVYYVIGGVVLIAFYWLFGYIWDETGCYIIQNEWANKRNKFMIDMRRKFNIESFK